MNENTSTQPEAASAENTASRQKLDKLLLHVERHVLAIMRKEGRLSPTFFVASPIGLSIYSPGHLNDILQKNEFAAVARLICAARGAVACVLALETWALEAKPGERLDPTARPSRSPLRKEYICLSGEALGGLCEQKLLPILRDRRSRFSCLGTAKVFIDDPAQGRFANLLPLTPLTDQAQSVAVSILNVLGSVVTTVPSEDFPDEAFPA
jgi:hypothetical protein